MKVPIIWHKVTKNKHHNFCNQKPTIDIRRGEQILLPRI